MAVIEVKNLTKDYKVNKKGKGLGGAIKNLFVREKTIVHAVKDLSFTIEKGEIVAFIGPNGAGKSTTVKMMSGILNPTSGQVLVNGKDVAKKRKEVVMDLGVVFGQRTQLNWDLRLGESFELMKRIYQIPDELYKENLKVMDDILGINEIIDIPVRQLSLGQRMRGDLVAAMLHSPSVLFLDEPTIGLDVDGKYAIRKFIKEINRVKGTTVILTTHYMEEAAEADYIVVLDSGKVAAEGTPLALKNAYTSDYITLYGATESQVQAFGLPYTPIRDAYRITIGNPAVATQLIGENPELFRDYEITKGKMDDVFLAITGRDLTGGDRQ